MLDLSQAVERAKLAFNIGKAIDTACVEHLKEDPRTHLGASIIGHECARYAWNVFRWIKFEAFSGQMLRLFNRGHDEEHRFVKWLRLAGCRVEELDPDTGKQFRIVGALGHFGGSLDGKIWLPAWANYDPALLVEFKTHNDKSFKAMQNNGVAKSKPQHFSQMCSYGRAYNLEYALYCAVNKNTDELYLEIVKLNFGQADDLFRKAEYVVFSKEPPAKIAQDGTFYKCKMCDFNGICFKDETPVKNCRSCRLAVPIIDAQWYCELHKDVIPPDFIPVGCDSYARIV